MSAVVISKSPPVVVKPSEPVTATGGHLNMSSYDKWFVNIPATVFLVFEHPIQEPVDTIKRGLSQALVHYYPIAGRLAAGATAGEVVIRCTTDDGVPFVAASANCGIKDLLDYPSLKEELAVFYPAADGMCRFSDPLLLMQVTVFSCGGFVLGVTWNHAVADGVGIGKFMQAVGELSRGLPSPSVVPEHVHFDDGFILGMPPVFTEFLKFMGSLRPSQMAPLDITVKASLINRIKDEYVSRNSGRPCTVFEAIAAVLWRCRTRVIMSDPEAPTVIIVPTNARKYTGAKEGYYGNCVLAQLATATAGAVANGDVMDLVKTIHGAKDRVFDMEELLHLRDSYTDLFRITSWRNIGLEAPDFGAGRPARLMVRRGQKTTDMPKCIVCIPCPDDYNVRAICVKEDHAGAFLQELAHMHLAYI